MLRYKPIANLTIDANFTAQSEGITTDDVVRKILEEVPQTEPLA